MRRAVTAGLKSLIVAARQLAQYPAQTRLPREVMRHDMPYFSQWESADMIAAILAGTKNATDDPLWRQSGASTKAEYNDWSWAACGMACTKMIIARHTGNAVPIVTLGKRALGYGVYKMPLAESSGLHYAPYSTFVAKEFGWRAQTYAHMTLTDIYQALARGDDVIVSVSPAIRTPEVAPKTRGGHLIIVVGYDIMKGTITLHNPSGTNKNNQAFAVVPTKAFMRFFAHRGIVVTA